MLLVLCLLGLLGNGVYAQSSVFCEGLGTFTDDPPFDRLPVPHCPEELGGDLVLEYYTVNNPTVPTNVTGTDRTTIPVVWQSLKETVFVIHGWTNDIDSIWMQPFKNQLLDHQDINVILVGWGGPQGAGDLNYQKSASTTRTIGAHVGEVVQNLIENGNGDPDRFHILGHSLGAQTTGHAGRWSSVENGILIRRCTGLDPAGPEFVSVDDRTIGIWTDCAAFVDTLNTDQALGSTPTSCGHQNYYPNAGEEQPGCGGDTCDHARAIDFYQESIDQSCIFYSRDRCSNPGNLPGSCTSCVGTCGAMGYPAEAGGYQAGDYYLTTNIAAAPNHCAG